MMGRLALAWAVMVFWSGPVSADTIEMTTGERVEGALKEATPAGVVIEVAGQSIRFDVNKVRAIYFGLPSVQALQPPPAPVSPAKPVPPVAGALQLLQSLQSAVANGMSLREYEARVDTTAPLVAMYLGSSAVPPGAEAIRDAMRYYVLAEWAWSNQGTASRTVWLKKDDALARCSTYQEFARDMQDKGEAYYSERLRGYVVIADGVVPVLWSCASDKIAEAERLVVNAKR